MPPLGTVVPDHDAVGLIDAWLRERRPPQSSALMNEGG
jgi:hypothetical protein